MSSIFTHDDGPDSDDDLNYDYETNSDQVDYDHNDENQNHSTDLSDDNEKEFPMPVPLPVPMPRETEEAGSHRETNLPAAPVDWETPSCSSSESREVALEKELEDLRIQFRLLNQQYHEKQHEPAHSDQRPSKGTAFETRRRRHEKQDNTQGGSFSNHDKHPGPTAQAASTKANMQLHSAESQMPVPGPNFPREHHDRKYDTTHDTQRDHRGSIRDLRTKLAENQARINRGEGKGGTSARFMTPAPNTAPHHSNPYFNMGGADGPREKKRDTLPKGTPKTKFDTDYHDLEDLASNSGHGETQTNPGKFSALKHMSITLPEYKQRQGPLRGNERTWRKAVVTAANTLKGLHLLEQEKHIAITVEKANELFGRQGYNLGALATPARRIDPVTKEVNKNWAALLDVKPIAQDKQARELKQYANLVLNLDLKNIRVWVTQGINGDPVPESALDGERRTILHAHMIKSLKGAAHITEDVCDGDVASLFSRVVQADQPEPKALLVDTLTRLSGHKKTENFSYIKWVTELKAIFDTLRAVQFDLSEDFQSGYLLALVRLDKRYEDLVVRLLEKNRNYESCLTLLRRRADKLGDLKGGNAPAGVQIDTAKTEIHLTQQGKGTGGKGTGNQRGRDRGGKGGAPTEAATDKETIDRLQKQIVASKKAMPCRQFAKGACTRGDTCHYSHKVPRADRAATAPEKSTAATPTKAVKAGKDGKLVCYTWAATTTCPKGDTCKFQHELNMLMHKSTTPDPFSLNDILLISEKVTGMGMVTGRVTGSSVVKRKDGKSERFYALDVPFGEIIHKDFKEMAAEGIPRSYLKLHEKAPQVTHEILLTQSASFNGALDGGATCCVANSRRLIQPGSERKVNVTATLTDKRDMCFSEGGLINLRKQDGTMLTILALLNEGAERTIISKGLLKDLGYCEIDDPAHPEVTNLWLDGKLQFSFPRRTPAARLTSKQAMSEIHVSGLSEIPDHIFEIAAPRQEFQLTEYKPVDRSEPTEGLHSLHELHHLLTAQNKSDKLGPIQIQTVLGVHDQLAHTDIRKCAFCCGIRLRDSLALALQCPACMEAKSHNRNAGPKREATTELLSRVTIDSVGPFPPTHKDNYQYFHTITVDHISYTEIKHTCERGEIVDWVDSWVLHAHALHHPKRIVAMDADGAPELKSNSFRAKRVAEGINLRTGAPNQHTDQTTAERVQGTIQRMSLTIRVAAGVPQPYSAYADRQATHVLQRLPTSDAIASHKPTKEDPRPLSPYELWTGQSAPSFQALHSDIFTFGMEGFAHKPKETRAKGDIPGVRVVYLCPATPNKGHLALIIATGKVKVFPFIKMHQGVFPFLIELRKTVPKALLSFEPATLKLIQIKAEPDPVILEKTEDEKVATPMPVLKPFDPGGGDKVPVAAIKTKAQRKKAGKLDPQRFKINDTVMTREGPAIVERLTGDHIPSDSMNLSWPGHHHSPGVTYTVKRSMAWYISERPGDVFDSHGNHIHELNLVAIEKVITAMYAPGDVVGTVPADTINLPTYARKRESPYCTMINDAEDKEWDGLNAHGMFSKPVAISSLSEEQRRRILRLQWLYKAKSDEAGFLSRIKARLVADGSREKGVLPAGDIYTPVMVMSTVRIMLVVGLQDKHVRFWQLDVVSAYSTALCTREIYVYFPPGRLCPSGPGYCMRTIKALYGVVDSGRLFYDEWIEYHLDLGFQPIHSDKCYLMFYRGPNEFIRICFHVDDNIISQRGDELWTWYQTSLKLKYELVLHPLHYCMGIEFAINYEKGIIKMTQGAQIEKMLRDLDMENCRPARCPVSTSKQPSLDEIEKNPSGQTLKFPMMAFLGHLNCLQQGTRPDITRALKIASKFGTKFGAVHIEWVKRIVRYLAGNKSIGIVYRRVPAELANHMQIFSDSTHASDPDTRRSISGISIKLAGNLVLWKANFQTIVSHSSTESEIMCLDTGGTLGQYAKWICNAVGINPIMPIPIFIDSQSSMDIMQNPIQAGRNLHMHARFFYMRDHVINQEYALVKIATEDQISDVLVTFKDFPTFHRLRFLLLHCAFVEMVDGIARWNTMYL